MTLDEAFGYTEVLSSLDNETTYLYAVTEHNGTQFIARKFRKYERYKPTLRRNRRDRYSSNEKEEITITYRMYDRNRVTDLITNCQLLMDLHRSERWEPWNMT